MTRAGTEHPLQNSGKTGNSDSGGAESGAQPDLSPSIAPELADLIDAWASLSEPVRRGILAMVDAAKGVER